MMTWLNEVNWAASLPSIGAAIIAVAGLAGIVLTAITFPGAWIAIAVSLLVWWWQPALFEWYTFLVAVLFAALGEVVEFLAGALGAAKAGASKKGMIGATVGTIIGAIVGIPFVPPLGAIVGSVLGAAVGAFVGEYGYASRHWKDRKSVV